MIVGVSRNESWMKFIFSISNLRSFCLGKMSQNDHFVCLVIISIYFLILC